MQPRSPAWTIGAREKEPEPSVFPAPSHGLSGASLVSTSLIFSPAKLRLWFARMMTVRLLSPEHARENLGSYSPGPKYRPKSQFDPPELDQMVRASFAKTDRSAPFDVAPSMSTKDHEAILVRGEEWVSKVSTCFLDRLLFLFLIVLLQPAPGTYSPTVDGLSGKPKSPSFSMAGRHHVRSAGAVRSVTVSPSGTIKSQYAPVDR